MALLSVCLAAVIVRDVPNRMTPMGVYPGSATQILSKYVPGGTDRVLQLCEDFPS